MLDNLKDCETKAQYASSDCGAAIGGDLRNSCGEPARPNLRERIGRQLDYAQAEARKASLLRELARLLDKNPDMTRILDLLEEVQ